jgi:hypothetical protein
VKRLLLIVAVLVVAAGADAATVVLKGGKHLDVASVQRQGNYFVVRHASGRLESYPAAAVDVEATRVANEVPAPAATPAPALGPHSPFFGAQSIPGKPVIVVTDDDVQHVVAPDEEPSAGAETAARPPAEGQVVLVDYGKQQIEDGVWEITATVINSGSSPVTGVAADVRLLDAEGKVIGSGTATMAGTLAPTQQGAVTARVAAAVEPIQIGFSFRWQAITPQPAASAADAGAGGEAAAPDAAQQPAAAQAPAPPPGYTVPPGSSPNTLPTNPMAVPGNLLEPPVSLQVARPQPEKPKA